MLKKTDVKLTANVSCFIWGRGCQLKNILTIFLIVFSTHHHILQCGTIWQSIANESDVMYISPALMRWVCLIACRLEASQSHDQPGSICVLMQRRALNPASHIYELAKGSLSYVLWCFQDNWELGKIRGQIMTSVIFRTKKSELGALERCWNSELNDRSKRFFPQSEFVYFGVLSCRERTEVGDFRVPSCFERVINTQRERAVVWCT